MDTHEKKKEKYNLFCWKSFKNTGCIKNVYTTAIFGTDYLHWEHRLILKCYFFNLGTLKFDETLILKILPHNPLAEQMSWIFTIGFYQDFFQNLLMTAICQEFCLWTFWTSLFASNTISLILAIVNRIETFS